MIPRFLCYRLSQLLGVYLRDIISARFIFDAEMPRHGFLFGDKDGPWKTNRISRAMIRETQSRLGYRITVADFRHIAHAIDKKFIRKQDAIMDEDEEDEDNIHDLMAAHTSKISNARYARLIGLTRSLTSESIDEFRKVSDKGQKFLRLVSRRERVRIVEQAKELDPLEIRTYIEKALTRMYGRGATWKSEVQREAVMATANGVHELIIVLPTGAGKSLTFMLPAMLPNARTTILITPLRALAENMLQRCNDICIDAYIYGGIGEPRRARIVIVVSDTAISTRFLEFIAELHIRERLDRIVFDECHKIITDRDFRSKMYQLRHIVVVTQMVFLTATFPPSMLDEFKDAMIIKKPRMVRVVNQKPQVRYSVSLFEGRDYESQMAARIQEIVNRCTGLEKVLVFCRSRKDTERWAEHFNCTFFHSQVEEKGERLIKWREGLMFATGSLGAGVDVDQVMYVVHLGIPYGMVDFDQEVGRGGRGGEIFESLVFLSEMEKLELVEMDENSLTLDRKIMREYLLTEECRRRKMGKYLNGEEFEINCLGIGGELCDRCRAGEDGELQDKRRRREEAEVVSERNVRRRMDYEERSFEHIEKERQIGVELDVIMNMFKRFESICCVCWLIRGVEIGEHNGKECEEWRRRTGGRYGVIRNNYCRRIADSCCWTCSLPGDLCEHYKSRAGKSWDGSKCTNVDSIWPLVLMAFLLRKELGLEVVLERVCGCKYDKMEDFGSWLNEKGQYWDVNGTQAFGLFGNIIIELVRIRKNLR